MRSLSVVFIIYIAIKSFTIYDCWFRAYDVGQGDALVISLPGEDLVVVDGGANIEIDRYLSREHTLNTCKIALLVLTHPHYDHLIGLTRLLQHCSVERVLHYPVDYSSSEYNYWKELLVGSNVEIAVPGDTIRIGKSRLFVLGPIYENLTNVNNSSVILLFQYGNFDALLLGDAEVQELASIDFDYLSRLVHGELEMLKVSHHGAKNAFLESWPEKLYPETCVISVGKENKFSHPHQEALDFYSSIGCIIRRTDVEGTIEISLE